MQAVALIIAAAYIFINIAADLTVSSRPALANADALDERDRPGATDPALSPSASAGRVSRALAPGRSVSRWWHSWCWWPCSGRCSPRTRPTSPIGPPGAGPQSAALLGTDYLGRDVLSRVLHGGLSLIAVTFVAVVLTYALGTALGLAAGFMGGWVDSGLMRLADLFMGFPPLLLLLVLIVGAGSSDLTIVIGIVAVLAAPLSRLVYSATLEASATILRRGRSDPRGAAHRDPRSGDPARTSPRTSLASFGVYVSGAVIFVASLSFLGVGAQPPAADWGLMITENQPVSRTILGRCSRRRS